MEFYFNYPNDFISEEMAIAFLREKKMLLKEGQKINAVMVQVHKNFKEAPLRITFSITYQGGGDFKYFNFMEYYNWFEDNKFKYLT